MRSLRKQWGVGIAAFSLIEVVISLGIVSFAFIGLLALLPSGMKSNHDSVEESRAMNLLQTMVADWQITARSSSNTNSPLYNLPSLTPLSTITSNNQTPIYVGEDGTTNSSAAKSFYRVTYTIYPNTNYMQPAIVDLKATWPAASTNRQSSVEMISTFLP